MGVITGSMTYEYIPKPVPTIVPSLPEVRRYAVTFESGKDRRAVTLKRL